MVDFFIGREKELSDIQQLFNLKGPRLLVIKGRRRVGKSRLAKESAKGKVFLDFSGLTPNPGMTAQDQRDAFARQFAHHFNLPPLTFTDWSDAFMHLMHQLTIKPTVILMDEISWMSSSDPTFVPKLKVWWDLYLQNFPELTLIFCGSVSTWIEKNIINSTSFFGRISLQIDLGPLSLPESIQFLQKIGFKGSTYEIFEILSITGGIPWYLEKIDPKAFGEENIKRLCFQKDGLLVKEFDYIFHDLFSGRAPVYNKVIHALGGGNKTQNELRAIVEYPKGGAFSDILKDLIICGFISQHQLWSLQTGALSRTSFYRLSDCYLRFYLKFIEPKRSKIESNAYRDVSIHQLPGWDSMMGIQIESLLLQNRALLLKSLNIHPIDVNNDNPYVQVKTTRHKGCQIDYLIQTQSRNFYVCEFKCRSVHIGSEIIREMEDKLKRFSTPRGYGVAPVLFHFGTLSEAIYESSFFYRIISIPEMVGLS